MHNLDPCNFYMKRSASQFDMGAKAQHHPKSSWGDFAPLALLMFFSFFKKKGRRKTQRHAFQNTK
jgi:hypothetical protein